MSKIVIVTVDVSKGYGDFIAVNTEKAIVLAPFRLDDNAEGHTALTNQFKLLKKTHGATRILFVAESTGGLEDNWLRLVRKPELSSFVEGYRLNPKVIHHEYQVQKRSSISDAVSSLTMAHHVAKHLEQFNPNEIAYNPDLAAARSLIRHLVTLQDQNTEHKNSLQQLLYQYLPSLINFIPRAWSAYFLVILATYDGKRGIQQAAKQGFKKIKNVPKGKAAAFYKALSEGVDMKQTPELIVLAIKSKARKILELKAEISELEQALCRVSPYRDGAVELLCSIKGMGAVTATILMSFIEDVSRFDNAASMAAFFGVQPRAKVSGDGRTKTRMSKQGSAIVRRELYLLAFRTISHEPYLKSLYAKAKKQGRVHDDALGILMHKLIRIIYGMLKTNTAFDPGVDQLNKIDPRTKEDKIESASDQNSRRAENRLQAPGLNAPISARQRRKRKKDQELQEALAAPIAESS